MADMGSISAQLRALEDSTQPQTQQGQTPSFQGHSAAAAAAAGGAVDAHPDSAQGTQNNQPLSSRSVGKVDKTYSPINPETFDAIKDVPRSSLKCNTFKIFSECLTWR